MSKSNSARSGAVSEFLFMAEATRLGLSVSAPILNFSPYDAVVDTGKRFVKVQIKSAKVRRQGKGAKTYVFSVEHSDGRSSKKTYSAHDVNYFAFYAADDQMWFIVPYKVVAGMKRVRITLGRANRLDKYKNAWQVLR